GEADAPTRTEAQALKQRLKEAPRSEESLTLSEQLGLKFRRVVIDAGHGGHDSGAVGRGGLKEKDVTLAVARRVADMLADSGLEGGASRGEGLWVGSPVQRGVAGRRGGSSRGGWGRGWREAWCCLRLAARMKASRVGAAGLTRRDGGGRLGSGKDQEDLAGAS